jgi:hypothetical protein
MRSFDSSSMRLPRFCSVSTAFAPHQAHLSRQVCQSQQVATRDRHLILSFHAVKSAYHRSAHRRPCLRPSMYPLGHLPLSLANRVSRISSSACIDGATAWTARVLCHVRGDIARSTLGNKFSRIVVLVGAQRSPPGVRGVLVFGDALVHHRQCRLALCRASGMRQRVGSR